jgi:hypothetical protein
MRATYGAAEQAAEKVDSAKIFVGQALLPVRVLLHLPKMDSQEWLSYWTFSATCEAAPHKDSTLSRRLISPFVMMEELRGLRV